MRVPSPSFSPRAIGRPAGWCRSIASLRRLGMLLVALAGLIPQAVSGQVIVDDDLEDRRQRREAHSPRLENALLQARGLQKSNPDLSLDILQSIFDSPEDSYFKTDQGCSLKEAAELVLLADIDLLKSYERRFEAAASGLLEKSRREPGLSGLREVARRYALTASGRRAMMDLASAACDSGDAASALRQVYRLRLTPSELQSFEPRLSLIEIWALREMRQGTELKARLEDLKRRFPAGLEIDGRRIAWFTGDDEQERWLASLLPPRGSLDSSGGLPAWTMAHGERRRNGVATQAPPFLDTAWKAALADQYDDIRKYDDPWNDADIKLVSQAAVEVETRFRREGLHPLPVASPLISGNLAIFAGFGTVKAFHLKTGELVWSSLPVDETLQALLAGTDSFIRTPKPQLMQQYVGQRAYRDHVDAALSTDGRRVYHVGHSGLVGLMANSGTLPVSSRGPSQLLPRNYNHLQAYDIEGGLCVWSIGGPSRRIDTVSDRPQDEFNLDGAFFHSAPIPWEGELLCIVEQSRQLRIVSLDPEKNPQAAPPLLWSQALLNSDMDLVYTPDRRFAGVTVALDGSTLIAAIGNGTVIGFDVADRRWLWMHTYADPQPVDYRRMLQITRVGRAVNDQANLDVTLDVKEWSESRSLIVGSRVLVTPADDSQLLCLDRQSGQRLWARPRDQAMYLAGVHNDVVVLVGKSDVRGLKLETGEPLWTTPIPPASGRGVRMGSRYLLPLSTAEVLTLDITTGAPLARSPLASGEPAGNLAAAEGMLITQTGAGFRAFRAESDVTREINDLLAKNESDPVALALRGELKLHQGDVAGGEKDLKAIPNPPPRVQQVLAWALVNGLERDFAAYYTPDLKLDELPQDAGLRMQAWSAVSRGLEARKDLPGALLAALRAGESINAQSDRLLDREDSLRVRENRLIRGRIDDLWESMNEEQRSRSVALIRERLGQLNPASPEHFRVVEMLTGRILPPDIELDHLQRRNLNIVVTEQRLLRLRESADPAITARANLQLLQITTQDPRMTPPPSVVADLTGRLAGQVLADGKTAGELAAAILNQPDYLKRRDAARALSGELVVAGLDDFAGISDLPSTLLQFGPRSPILEGWTFAADAMQSILYAIDGRGVIRMQERIPRGITGVPARVSTSGRLVLAETADGFRIFDAISNMPLRSTTLASEPFDLMGGNFGRVRVNRTARPSLVSPLRAEHLAYMRGSELLVVDPLTGRELWTRAVEGTLDLSSDQDFIAAQVPRGRIKVFRASDGRLVREATLPTGMLLQDYRHDIQRLLSIQDAEAIQIGLFHPARESWTWQKKFPLETRFDVLNGRYVAALQANGRLTLLAEDGREMLNVQLEIPPDLQRLEVFEDGSRIYVAAVRFSIGADILSSIPQAHRRPISARLIALDRVDGRQLWSRDFERLMLDPAQPGQWPFLVMIAAGEPDEANEERSSSTLAFVLDRATGKTLHAAELQPTASSQRGFKVDQSTGAVSLRINGVGFQVSPPAAPPAPQEPAAEKPPASGTPPASEPKTPPAPEPAPPPPPLSKPGD